MNVYKVVMIYGFLVLNHAVLVSSDKQLLEKFMKASQEKDHEALADLLSQGIGKVDYQTRQKVYPLFQAAEFCLDNQKYKRLGENLLWSQVQARNVQGVQLLLDLQASDCVCDAQGNTLLHTMCFGDKPHLKEVINVLQTYEKIYRGSRDRPTLFRAKTDELIANWTEQRRYEADSSRLSAQKSIIEILLQVKNVDQFDINEAHQTPREYAQSLLEKKLKQRPIIPAVIPVLKKSDACSAQSRKRTRSEFLLQELYKEDRFVAKKRVENALQQSLHDAHDKSLDSQSSCSEESYTNCSDDETICSNDGIHDSSLDSQSSCSECSYTNCSDDETICSNYSDIKSKPVIK